MGDLLREAAASINARRLRTLVTSAGIALGVAAFLAATSVAEAAAASINTRLERLAVTTVTLRLDISTHSDVVRIVDRAEHNLLSLSGVTSVGASIDLSQVVRHVDGNPNIADHPRPTPVLAVSPRYPIAVEALPPLARSAVTFSSRGGPVALFGSLVRDRIELGARSLGQTVFVAGRPFEILGSTDTGAVDARVDESILVPLDAAATFGWLDRGIDEVVIVTRTQSGRAHDLAERIRLLAWPENPELVSVTVSADPRQLRAGIEADTLLLVGGLSLLLLAVGVLSIANVMLASVMERLSEIGLRRALGASRMVVGVLLLFESSAIGFLGGLLGSVLGICGSVVASLVQGWSVSFDPTRALLAPVAGALIGGIAGLYPALRAARIDPATTLRGGL
jgi:putative ABC transport system permease protein